MDVNAARELVLAIADDRSAPGGSAAVVCRMEPVRKFFHHLEVFAAAIALGGREGVVLASEDLRRLKDAFLVVDVAREVMGRAIDEATAALRVAALALGPDPGPESPPEGPGEPQGPHGEPEGTEADETQGDPVEDASGTQEAQPEPEAERAKRGRRAR